MVFRKQNGDRLQNRLKISGHYVDVAEHGLSSVKPLYLYKLYVICTYIFLVI
jgi:hypothetical protein